MGNDYEFNSILAPHICGLVAQKRAHGFSYKSGAYLLQHFDRFCNSLGLLEVSLPRELVMEWLVQRSTENLNTRNHRVSLIRQLALYMGSFGLPVYMPKQYASGEKSAPYILQSDELSALFHVIDGQQPCYKHPQRFIEAEKIVYRMFYCCGLRLSEGLYLRRVNVDLTHGILSILQSKGDKDRLVFMADDLAEMCRNYSCYISKECPNSPWFFPGKNPDNPLSHCTLPTNFARYWGQIPFANSCNKHPTPHSLRHTFVVDKMNEWMLSGVELRTMLPYLSRYLGHTTVNDTLYYYHLVDRAFQVVHQKDTALQDLIPEATLYEE